MIRIKPGLRIIFLILLLGSISCAEKREAKVRYVKEGVDKPELFAPGVISTQDADEFDMTVSPDGREVYFTRRRDGEKQKILSTTFHKGTWTMPEIATFSTDRDETPSFAADRNILYFGSQRELPGRPNKGGFDMNIWKVERVNNSWGAPEPLPSPINEVQQEGENWPSSNANFFFTRDGREFYYSSMYRGDEGITIYRSTLAHGKYAEPVKITGLLEDEKLWKYSASVSPDGKYLVFNSYNAPGGMGGEDLYISQRTKEGWSPAKNMGSLINSPGEESSGRFSPDGHYFFFTHADNLGDDQYSEWSIYFIETEFLDLDSLFR